MLVEKYLLLFDIVSFFNESGKTPKSDFELSRCFRFLGKASSVILVSTKASPSILVTVEGIFRLLRLSQ